MNLSTKATRFIIEALEHFEKHHDHRIEEEGITEDELSDLMNDRQYLQSIKRALCKHHDALINSRNRIESDA